MDSVAIAYLIVFLVGFSFLVLTLVLGSLGGEVGHGEVHVEVGHGDAGGGGGGDGGVGHTSSPGLFSFRVMACFLVGFGAAALVSHYQITYDMPRFTKFPLDLGLGLAGGLLVGYTGWRIVKFFLSQQGFAEVTASDFVGVEAPLTLGIPQGGTGEITFNQKGKRLSLDVRSETGEPITTGTKVTVVSMAGSVGIVRRV